MEGHLSKGIEDNAPFISELEDRKMCLITSRRVRVLGKIICSGKATHIRKNATEASPYPPSF